MCGVDPGIGRPGFQVLRTTLNDPADARDRNGLVQYRFFCHGDGPGWLKPSVAQSDIVKDKDHLGATLTRSVPLLGGDACYKCLRTLVLLIRFAWGHFEQAGASEQIFST